MDKLILEECLYNEVEDSDSSGSSDEGVIEYILMSLVKKRKVSVANHSSQVAVQYTNEEFIRHFRLSKEVFELLLGSISSLGDRNKVPADKKLMLFLWFAGHEASSYRDLSERFNVSLSTVNSIITNLSKCISSMSDKYIVWPDQSKRKECEMFFLHEKQFPGVIGCIDATKIIIDPPEVNKNEYIDRNGNTSLTMQLVCDHEKKFIDFFVGQPGSVTDAMMYSSSELSSSLKNKVDESQYLVGGSAYPCSNYLLTPYRDNARLTSAQQNFNDMLGSCTEFIEDAICVLKQRFRQLYYCKLKGVSMLCHFIRACVVLHNLCSIEDVSLFEPPQTEEENQGVETETQAKTSSIGKELRDKICEELWKTKVANLE